MPPRGAPSLTSDLGSNTHRVQVASRALKAVPIVVDREGEVVTYGLLEKTEGGDEKTHIRTPTCFQNPHTVAWTEDRGGKGTSK